MQENGTSGGCPKIKCIKKILYVVAALVILRAIYLFGFMPIGYEIKQPQATAATACPTTDVLTGTSSYETAPVKSAAAAIASANSLLQVNANTEGGLAFNAYKCPNPSCPKKQRAAVIAGTTPGNPSASAFTFWAMAATAADLFSTTYYSGLMDYSWKTTVVCTK